MVDFMFEAQDRDIIKIYADNILSKVNMAQVNNYEQAIKINKEASKRYITEEELQELKEQEHKDSIPIVEVRGNHFVLSSSTPELMTFLNINQYSNNISAKYYDIMFRMIKEDKIKLSKEADSILSPLDGSEPISILRSSIGTNRVTKTINGKKKNSYVSAAKFAEAAGITNISDLMYIAPKSYTVVDNTEVQILYYNMDKEQLTSGKYLFYLDVIIRGIDKDSEIYNKIYQFRQYTNTGSTKDYFDELFASKNIEDRIIPIQYKQLADKAYYYNTDKLIETLGQSKFTEYIDLADNVYVTRDKEKIRIPVINGVNILDSKQTIYPVYGTRGSAIPTDLFRSMAAEISYRNRPENIKGLDNKYKEIATLAKIHVPESEEDIKNATDIIKHKIAKNYVINMKNKISSSSNTTKTLKQPWLTFNHEYYIVESNFGFKLRDWQKDTSKRLADIYNCGHKTQTVIDAETNSGKTITFLMSILPYIKAGWNIAIISPTVILSRQTRQEFCKLYGCVDDRDEQKYIPPRHAYTKQLHNLYGDNLVHFDYKKAKQDGIKVIPSNLYFGCQGVMFNPDKGKDITIIDEEYHFSWDQKTMANTDHLVLVSATISDNVYALTKLPWVSVFNSPTIDNHQNNNIIQTSNPIEWLKDKGTNICRNERTLIIVPRVANEVADNWKDVISIDDVKSILDQYHISNATIVGGNVKGLDTFNKDKNIQVLVASNVVESGLNINCNQCIILDANYFSINSIHQMRNRIARGNNTSHANIYIIARTLTDSIKSLNSGTGKEITRIKIQNQPKKIIINHNPKIARMSEDKSHYKQYIENDLSNIVSENVSNKQKVKTIDLNLITDADIIIDEWDKINQ